MCDLQRVNAEYRHSGVDTEALQAGQHGVGPDEEGDHVSEGGDGDSNTRVLHRLAKPESRRSFKNYNRRRSQFQFSI